jgi:capsular polysaccharide biosynthesis protein
MTYTKKENGKIVKEVKNVTSDKMQSILNKKKVTILQNQKKRRMS